MSHWNGYETRDIFDNDDNGVNNLLPFQDGEEILESVTCSDSHKKPRCVAADGTSINPEGSATEAALPKKDAVRPTVLEEGSYNILDPSFSFISKKAAPALRITKCSVDSSILDCQGNKISTASVREGENDTGSNMLCLDYGKRGDAYKKKLGDISSVETFVGIPSKKQMNGEDDLLLYDYSIGHLEDFERMFRNHVSTLAQGSTATEDEMAWFSSSSHGFHGAEDTLQSVVLSSVSASSAFNSASSSRSSSINILPGTKSSANSIEIPSGSNRSPLPMYTDAERKHKSLISELAYDHVDIVDRSPTLEQIISYEDDRRNTNMIDSTLKEASISKGKEINPTYGYTVQSSLSGCGMIQNVPDQELLSFVLPASQPCSPHVISMQTLLSESFTSNCLNSFNPQAQMSKILKSTIINSSDSPDYISSNNLPSHSHPSMGMLPGSFSMPSMPMEKSNKIYACQQFPGALLMDKPLENLIVKSPVQQAEASGSSPQKKYKFKDIVEGDEGPAVNMVSSTLQDKCFMTNTFIDNISIKAASFQQLQMIMDRLGVRTKVCIRDSLYRLARSAEQSHCYGSANNVSSASSPMRGFQGSKRPPEYLDLSSSTNEIERAVAYLLFHKSLAPGTGPTDDGIWLRTPVHIQDPAATCKDPYLPTS